MYLRLSFMIAVLVQAVTAPANPIFNVRDFGAKGDGQHIDSPAINAAIEQAAKEGGGMVVLTEGVYPCYSVHLKSNTTLRLEKGAVLKAAPVTETEGYDEAEPNDSHYQDYGHSHWHNSLLWGECYTRGRRSHRWYRCLEPLGTARRLSGTATGQQGSRPARL